MAKPSCRKAHDTQKERDPAAFATCDLPLNFHPAGTGALWFDTPIGAGGATDIRAELSDGAAR
ncbi:MAG: hypothetical protein RID11_15045, partial [Roseovarius sp.]